MALQARGTGGALGCVAASVGSWSGNERGKTVCWAHESLGPIRSVVTLIVMIAMATSEAGAMLHVGSSPLVEPQQKVIVAPECLA